MSRKIVGVTVGTPISPESMRNKMQAVKSVNGMAPDESGNVEVEVSGSMDYEYNEETGNLTLVSLTGAGGGGTGADGKDGKDGVGIADIRFKEQTDEGNVYTITLTNGNKYEIVAPKGEQGIQGVQGEQGVPGNPGAKGDPGYTPVKGTDYFTEADKLEVVNYVLAALPKWTGGSY